MTTSLGSIDLLEQLTELGEILTYIYRFIEGYDKGYRRIARGRDRLRSGRVPGSGLGVHRPPSTYRGCVHPPGCSLNAILLGF